MLVWRVLLDGRNYAAVDTGIITKDTLREMKQDGLIQDTAIGYCRRLLLDQGHEHGLVELILDALSRALEQDPANRSSSKHLFEHITMQLEAPETQWATPIPFETMDRLPQFDVR
jgi:hypothetical protein